jgi:hypothetical protein
MKDKAIYILMFAPVSIRNVIDVGTIEKKLDLIMSIQPFAIDVLVIFLKKVK